MEGGPNPPTFPTAKHSQASRTAPPCLCPLSKLLTTCSWDGEMERMEGMDRREEPGRRVTWHACTVWSVWKAIGQTAKLVCVCVFTHLWFHEHKFTQTSFPRDIFRKMYTNVWGVEKGENNDLKKVQRLFTQMVQDEFQRSKVRDKRDLLAVINEHSWHNVHYATMA